MNMSVCWFCHLAAHIYTLAIIIVYRDIITKQLASLFGERGGSVVECRTPEREVGGSKPTSAVLCP